MCASSDAVIVKVATHCSCAKTHASVNMSFFIANLLSFQNVPHFFHRQTDSLSSRLRCNIAYFRDFFRRKAIDFRQKQGNLIVLRQLVDRRFQFFQLPSVPQNIFGGRFSCRSILLFAELFSNLVKPFLLSPFPAAFRNSDRTKQVSHPILKNVPIEFVELLCRLFKRHPSTVFGKVLIV